ncbi:anthranilate phosphoribosyltransferase [Spirosoma utsteinense]|uniref:Anthranilate phosphoribosyltransferase n=1 Tax=Spirosoma utsteinense TaxID=2585773 RepID=A0ABR6W0U6_9BACT|nr:anthranilate phosphoribosyltransferase [Spirosoma utsteinense]MBC3783649.1 anthranilate phosphoribosyltransferase [Spirosoma utsteinense]MBC3790208.1 anthranilate phosphoribosyltransferase [Spirosoma utsteinense]
MKAILNHLFEYKTLSKEQARQTLIGIGQGAYNASQVASFLTVYMMRSLRVEELQGFRDAMLELCLPVDLDAYDPMDLCGTGGDGKDTFNISTLSSFVVAGAGQRVAKHGNHGVSSLVGSSTVMEHLGYRFTNDVGELQRKMETAGICFLHAPLFHPAMKNIGPIRKELGVKTFFNVLGPMVNPARPQKQLVGVFNLELARLYAYLYQQTDKQFMILHALDGYDEISLTGAFKVISNHTELLLEPKDLGMTRLSPESLAGGQTLDESAQIFMNVLNNQATTAQTQAVLANSAMALLAAGKTSDRDDAVSMARESLESGRALNCFKTLLK